MRCGGRGGRFRGDLGANGQRHRRGGWPRRSCRRAVGRRALSSIATWRKRRLDLADAFLRHLVGGGSGARGSTARRASPTAATTSASSVSLTGRANSSGHFGRRSPTRARWRGLWSNPSTIPRSGTPPGGCVPPHLRPTAWGGRRSMKSPTSRVTATSGTEDPARPPVPGRASGADALRHAEGWAAATAAGLPKEILRGGTSEVTGRTVAADDGGAPTGKGHGAARGGIAQTDGLHRVGHRLAHRRHHPGHRRGTVGAWRSPGARDGFVRRWGGASTVPFGLPLNQLESEKAMGRVKVKCGCNPLVLQLVSYPLR